MEMIELKARHVQLPEQLVELVFSNATQICSIAKRYIRSFEIPSMKERGRPAMLLVELGILLVPLTFVFVPCRRIVVLLERLQDFHRSMTQQSLTSGD
ncbi:hypothetical protein GUJ93_ZPchr0010g8451 [Zizania palustris]|uniref:Uncharacterized protein n=1 Tax=Zizania palustris TaxID=103762 RepID=A0A8J5W1B4_ZIZPA|nr:hypothetical protein GUJ93_ZPchr0010g8451 [Zizania palustris]